MFQEQLLINGPATKVVEDVPASGQKQLRPTIVSLAGGGYVALWINQTDNFNGSNNYAIFAQRYDAGGAAVGSQIAVSATSQLPIGVVAPTNPTGGFSAIGLADGSFVVAWSQAASAPLSPNYEEIYARVISAGGTPLAPQVLVNTTIPYAQTSPDVFALADGRFVVAWRDEAGFNSTADVIRTQMFDGAGQKIGSEGLVADAVTGFQNKPAGVALANGNFLLVWANDVGFAPFGTSTHRGQLFDSTGAKTGSEFQLSGPASSLVPLDIVALSTGGFLASWNDDRVQRYDAAGQPVGGLITTMGSQISVAALSGGAFAIGWRSGSNGGTVYLVQLYDADGNPMGSAATVDPRVLDNSVYQYTDFHITALANGDIVASWRTELAGGVGTVVSQLIDSPTIGTIGSDIFTGGGGDDRYAGMSGADQIDGGGGNDLLVGGSGDDTLDGGDGNDVLDLGQGNDTARGGAGDDAFYFGAAFTAADTVDGGAGTNDQIGLEGDYTGANALTLGAGTITGVEVLAVLPGFDYAITTADANVPNGGTLKVFAGNLGVGDNFTFNGAAETDGNFMVYGGQGTDLITAGAGNDGIYFGPSKFNPAVDRIDGGTGANDQLALDGHYTGLTLDGTAIKNVEAIVLLKGVPTGYGFYDLTLLDSLTGAGLMMTIWGTPVETGLVVDGTAESDGRLKIFGGNGADAIWGGAGDDWFWGGPGSDLLVGGTGADTFAYESADQSSIFAFDNLYGFNQAVDRIDLPTGVSITGFATPLSGALATEDELESAFGALGAHQAGVFTGTGGDVDGRVFLAIDANGVAGFQPDADFLIELVSPQSAIDSLAIFV